MSREARKLEHIKYALELGDSQLTTGLEDVHFLHNCLAAVNPEQVSLSTRIAGVRLEKPLFIDAITGGTGKVASINKKLAQVAAETGIAMAVGSQYGTVRQQLSEESYTVIREVNPEGIVFANVSALASPREAQAAVDMIGAAAVEIHLNVAQELIMPEGDRDFAGILLRLCRLQDRLSVPVIIKETGCGMAKEQLQQLLEEGFTCFNLAGAGGTSFAAIEAARSGLARHMNFANWGIPTAWSLLEAKEVCTHGESIIASGGIRDGWQMAKALAMGACAVGMAGNVLALVQEGVYVAVEAVNEMLADLQDIMILTGSASIAALHQVPLVYTGKTLEYRLSRSRW